MDSIGFTDEEIKQLNNKHSRTPKVQTRTKTTGIRHEKPSFPSTKLANKGVLGIRHEKPSFPSTKLANKVVSGSAQQKGAVSVNNSPLPNVDKKALFSKQIEVSPEPEVMSSQPEVTSSQPEVTSSETEVTSLVKKPDEPPQHSIEEDNPFKPDVSPAPEIQLSKIEQLQLAQAKLETENKAKHKELKDTITEKFAKTSQQAKLLKTLQIEVSSIEREMTGDITLLRDRIDLCNRRYCEARKRNAIAEQEYVVSKLELHKCAELKEGLEEHLFTIIKLNETKKSEKLAELYQKLERLGSQ